jgi:hypothetical protein
MEGPRAARAALRRQARARSQGVSSRPARPGNRGAIAPREPERRDEHGTTTISIGHKMQSPAAAAAICGLATGQSLAGSDGRPLRRIEHQA